MAGGERETFWRDALWRQATSHVSVAEFCRREGLSHSSFYAWRRILNERAGQPGKDAGLGVPAIDFLPVRVSETAPRFEPSITIELAGGLVLRLPGATPAARIAELVRALEETRR